MMGLSPRKKILIAAGPGGNGGGGLAGGRHLHNMGADVTVVLATPTDRLIPEAAAQLRTLSASGIQVVEPENLNFSDHDLIVDSIFGYGLHGDPRGRAEELIKRMVESDIPILSNDIPSGVEATSGNVHNPSVKASFTITIAMPKKGLAVKTARPFVGHLYLCNIAVPPDLYSKSFPDMTMRNPFELSEIVQIW